MIYVCYGCPAKIDIADDEHAIENPSCKNCNAEGEQA